MDKSNRNTNNKTEGTPMGTLTYDQWISIGITQGWCGPAVCYTHDGLPLTADEVDDFETGDPCIHIVRLYEDTEMRLGVELNHSPSNWRKPFSLLESDTPDSTD